MLTYVINTSENRTLNSDKLFDLAGYSRIRWMNCSLNDVQKCAQYIFEKQNVLGADSFRIAVLVDFFGFDRIRAPYGRNGYRQESGVDISLYLPYIETFLMDNLVSYLESRELASTEFDIYYVQNSKLERYDFLDNEESQLQQILSGSNPEGTSLTENQEEATFSSFDLYCTPNVTLSFPLSNYPYGAEQMTFKDFFKAFKVRLGNKFDLRRHYYISNYGGGNARAAFDTLTLSLHLIRMYEREESSPEEGEIEINHIDAEVLKDVLVVAWNKIYQARLMSKGNNVSYFSLKDNFVVDFESLQPRTKASAEELSGDHRRKTEKMAPTELYDKVCYYYHRTSAQLAQDHREEFDRLMTQYLAQRDETKDADLEAELIEKMHDGSLATTSQFPSEEEYLHLVAEKEKEISGHFNNVLTAMFTPADYTDEKNRADAAFEKYTKIKACMNRSVIGDLIFMVLSLLAVVGPYAAFQLNNIPAPQSWIQALQAIAVFGCLFLLSAMIQILILVKQLNAAKKELREAYESSYRKECDSLAQIRHKFNEDLIFIERARYEIRQLRFLYEANMLKDANIKRHRELLEELEDHVGSMLNKLDVEPILDPDETVSTEFDITKPIRSKENKVYRVFSLETIEKLFKKKKGSDK